MKVQSTKYPNLLVTSPKVQFVGGEAEVDTATAEKLAKLSHMGIVVPKRTSTRKTAAK
ncbi:MAG: hypothetical protein LKJ18_01930 [Ancrocorticia sp.]|nr:hypothetical protein [Ancrocorticia sp.]MCI1962898.1 hypothetical protein [Ancrocorticia sp.]MCI2001822.1 hypothetical protein [Ancrocorticia sp.]MCI2001875.1 hypothetical protein [Ancrocorticia sp.]